MSTDETKPTQPHAPEREARAAAGRPAQRPSSAPSTSPPSSSSRPGGRRGGGWPEQPPPFSPSSSGEGRPRFGQDSGGAGAYASPEYDSPRYTDSPSKTAVYDSPPGARPRRRRRRRRWIMALFALVVVLILAVVADFVGRAVAENDIADQVKTQAKLTDSPSVSIQGFPFLTQVLSKDLHEVDISMTNVPAGQVTITSIKAKIQGLHINSSWNGGVADNVTGTAFVSFGALGSALQAAGASQLVSVKLSQGDGPNKIKATANFAGVASVSQTATVQQQGQSVVVTWDQPSGGNGGGILGGILGGGGSGAGPTLPPLKFTLPSNVPAGLKIANVSVTSTGIVATVTAQHANLTQ